MWTTTPCASCSPPTSKPSPRRSPSSSSTSPPPPSASTGTAPSACPSSTSPSSPSPSCTTSATPARSPCLPSRSSLEGLSLTLTLTLFLPLRNVSPPLTLRPSGSSRSLLLRSAGRSFVQSQLVGGSNLGAGFFPLFFLTKIFLSSFISTCVALQPLRLRLRGASVCGTFMNRAPTRPPCPGPALLLLAHTQQLGGFPQPVSGASS